MRSVGVTGTPNVRRRPIPRGAAGGPSDGWRHVARLGGRMDSCLRRNDGGGTELTERGAGMTERGAGLTEGRRTDGEGRRTDGGAPD